MMLQTVPYYCIPRDEDGTPSREFDHFFQRALCWWPEIEIPEGMVSATSRKRGEEPRHKGEVALGLLRDGNDISQAQLAAAIDYLQKCVSFYENHPWEDVEPYPGRNEQAATSFRELAAEMGVMV